MRSWLGPAVELRHRKIRRRLAQNLIGLAEFAHLALQGLDALTIIAGWTNPQPLVALRLTHPAAQRLPCAANLRRNRADRCPLRGVIRLMLQYHSDCTRTDLG